MFNRNAPGLRPTPRPLATEEPITTGPAPTGPEAAEPLSDQEQQTLERLERIIKTGLTHFRELGVCLSAIKAGRLYRHAGSWDAYLKSRWGLSESTARRLIQAADLCRTLEGAGLPPVANEAQARSLNLVPESQRVDAWRQIVDTVPAEARTAELIAERTKRISKKRGRHKKPAAIKLRGTGWRIVIERSVATIDPTSCLQSAIVQLAERQAERKVA